MSHPEYSKHLLDHFRRPRGVGDVADPDAVAEVVSPVHGDRLRLSFAIRGGRLSEVRFRCSGCPVAIAAGSVAVELLTGRTVSEALALDDADVAEALGPLSASRRGCSVLVRQAVHAALAGEKAPE